MKILKYIFLFIIAFNLVGCNYFVKKSSAYQDLQERLDSLQLSYGIQVSDLDKAFATLNEVESGLQKIRERENILTIKAQQETDVPQDIKDKITEDINAIGSAIKQYQKEINKLKNDKKIESVQYKKRLSAIQSELKEKLQLIKDFKNQLEEKDKIITSKTEQISSLDEIVRNLRNDIDDMNVERDSLNNKVQDYEKELYSVYYIVGTKQELIGAGVLTKGGLFKAASVSYNAEKESFVKIDYREINLINTNASKAKVISIHPKDTYKLENVGGEVLLTILSPDEFWEQTKYLVIQTN